MTSRRLWLPALVLVLASWPGRPSAADQGVSIDLRAVHVDEPVHPGTTYRLPSITVRNEGDEASRYAVTARGIEGQREHQIPQEWLVARPNTFRLEPGEAVQVTIELAVPPDAASGSYLTMLGPSIVTERSGVSVGAGVAAEFTFDVPDRGWPAGVSAFFERNQGITVAIVGVLLLAAVLIWMLRRFTITIERR